MKFRTLGVSGLRVSVIGVGTWQLGGEWGKQFAQPEVDAMFDAARECQINLIDTAECYGDHTSERLIGAAIRRDRAQWVVATKFGHRYTGHLQRSDERSARDATTQVEASLTALQTDYIDLLQYHSIRDSEFDNDDLTGVLDRLVQSGKVRHLGNSIAGSINTLHQVDESTRRHVQAIQVIYNRLDRRPEEGLFQSCQRQNLGVLARVPLASGYLSGKYHPGSRFAAGDVRAGHDPQTIDRKLLQVEQIAREEVSAGMKIAQWALAWCLAHSAVTAVIPGCKDAAQVRANASAAEIALTHRQ
jgi:aryl-alcohol dehydrogenase-like predicted oxidoreductase